MRLPRIFCSWVGLIALVLTSDARLAVGAAVEQPNLPAKLDRVGFDAVNLRRTGQNHLFIFGSVEGRRRSCLVDTGWSFTTVSTNTAGRLAETNAIKNLRLGSLLLTNVPVVISDLRINGQPASYDVVLGCDFLLRHQAIVDCGKARLFLRRETARVTSFDLESLLPKAGWVGIPLRQRTPAALTCVASINGRATELLVDSGAMWSCLDQDFSAAAGLRASISLNRMTGPAADRQRSYAVADLKSWSLGGTPMPERTFAVFALGDWGLGANGKLFPDIEGILGGAELEAWDALIDCGNRKLWLRRKR